MLYFYEKEEVKNICVDEEGCLWVISSLGKIFKSDKDKQTLANMCLDDVIDDCSVLGLLSNKGNVWIITNKKYFVMIFVGRFIQVTLLRMTICW